MKLFFVALFIKGVNSPLAGAVVGRCLNALLVDRGAEVARGVPTLEVPDVRLRPSPKPLITSLSLEGVWNEFSTESKADRCVRPALRNPLVK